MRLSGSTLMVHMSGIVYNVWSGDGAILIVWLASLHTLDLRYVRPSDRVLARARLSALG